MSELYKLDATNLRKLLLRGDITPSDISTSLFKRTAELNPSIDAWEYLDEDIIARQIKKIDAGDKTRSLHGIPIGIKDIFNTFDMPTQMGSPLWKDFTPGNDARVVHYLRRNGAIIFGKTVTAEFAVHYQDRTHNPHNLEYSPGTSSSGSAAAVAANMVPVAFGSQTAGSISRPASYCGIYGLKPTFGVMARIGILKTTDSLDSIGFFTRSVEDLKPVFDASRVHGENYEYVNRYIDVHSEKKEFKVAVIEHPHWDKAEPYAKEAFNKWTKKLDIPEIKYVKIKLDDSINELREIHQIIYDKALAYYFSKEFNNHTLLSPIFYDIIKNGNKITSEQYQHAVKRQAQISHKIDEQLKEIDVILTLSTAGIAPLGLTTPDTIDSNYIWTALGMPTLSIPVFKDKNNLPFGALAISRKYQDNTLLDFAQLLKKREIIFNIEDIL